ncbi:hypothetical protein SNOG_07478 [Parastagonospora nodorum SN15]|uniref:Uncharacterized protein n=1 Tax=Phaeosphaeria nodorum (strain SN15 / ATCC MYA-4574 / FGSC 10173) TaxID=321614 RepID=Q0UL86_PHANO|nr:hypothetical protein SNOG_07478 [Parastagonospora nodorum SN15]EAT84944.2 hypothetical protein SNOG_07478 [Parastagonospora nodorum SN15]
MKSFAAIAAFAGAAAAQNLGQCAQLCVGNMATIAQSQFQCAQNDPGLLLHQVQLGLRYP